jgi:diguanylate cyclase (GGDEF)-like protein
LASADGRADRYRFVVALALFALVGMGIRISFAATREPDPLLYDVRCAPTSADRRPDDRARLIARPGGRGSISAGDPATAEPVGTEALIPLIPPSGSRQHGGLQPGRPGADPVSVLEHKAGLRLFALYAVLTLVPIAVLGFVLAQQFRADLERRGLEEGYATAQAISHSAIGPALSGDTLSDGVSPAERRTLIRASQPLLHSGDVLRIRLRDRVGHVAFDPYHTFAGVKGQTDDEVIEAIGGERIMLLTRLGADRVDGSTTEGERAIEVYTPVFAGNRGEAVGAVEVYVPYAPIAHSLAESEQHMTTLLATGLFALWAILAAITYSVTRRIRRSAQATKELARTDVLTGLGNRVALKRAVDLTVDAESSVLLVLDLADFGRINDTLGHANGDEFLRHVARTLTDLAPPGATVTRIGGDQFGVLLPETTTAATGDYVEAVRAALHTEYTIDGVAVTAEVAIGRVERTPGMDAVELLRRADLACREARSSKAPLVDWSDTLESFDADRLTLISELRHGIAEDQLVLHYQPKVRVDFGALTGVEALVRWEHPTRGLLMPGAFVPAAESTELIVDMTNWVLDAACRQGAIWQSSGRPLPIAVNVSARCLRDSEFSDRVLAALTRYQLRPELLTIEITETAVVSDPDRAAATLRRIARRGIKISLDDFGVGYTSLSQLDTLPIDELKVDRQFVAGLAGGRDGGAVVRAVVSIGHELGMSVVAEGVEDRATIAKLGSLGCDVAQGYEIARPAPVETFEAWWRERNGENEPDDASGQELSAPA